MGSTDKFPNLFPRVSLHWECPTQFYNTDFHGAQKDSDWMEGNSLEKYENSTSERQKVEDPEKKCKRSMRESLKPNDASHVQESVSFFL